ncbi:acyl carrier protein [Ligilactobacillus pobuzihii E100301 = KCTC 13174]|uniref:Acyl carrier protein n=2 Tax=Ligilactobacillus pobuzihii TaxID=449659 RepID=A0A0R2LLK9_9LACO|nr:acyl carrier protein [Ligilactobacillus pobuzihii E100301 = KCTC 13174]KRO02638.1 acyl carrier protein [Ligilactobacillus pobuzihii]
MSEVNKMTEKEVFAKIATIIEDRFNYSADKVTNELSFQDDLDADSIDIVEFVLELEDTFGAEISDDDAEKLTTVGQAVSYITAHQKN